MKSYGRGPNGVSLGEGRLVRKTDAAILVDLVDHGEQWIPNSQTHDDSEIYDESEVGEDGEVVVTRWFAQKEGLA